MGSYDAVLIVSFGGPEGPDDVAPFLDNVLRGRPVAPGRVEEVAGHYRHLGGISPINAHNRALRAAVRAELAAHGPDLPVYLGNRNWHPFLADTVAAMRDDGVQRALAFVTSAFGSYSGCRQYLEDLQRARAEVGAGAPALDKLRLFFDHPGFVDAVAEGLAATLAAAGEDPLVLFSAHSIPTSMAEHSPYQAQLELSASLVAARCGLARWELVYQSRSGRPEIPWLGPDVRARLDGVDGRAGPVVVCPLGFVSDHMEVVYDLDVELAAVAARRGIRLLRSPTPGTHPRFVTMIRQLVAEREEPWRPRPALGPAGPWPHVCPPGCCPGPPRRPPPVPVPA